MSQASGEYEPNPHTTPKTNTSQDRGIAYAVGNHNISTQASGQSSFASHAGDRNVRKQWGESESKDMDHSRENYDIPTDSVHSQGAAVQRDINKEFSSETMASKDFNSSRTGSRKNRSRLVGQHGASSNSSHSDAFSSSWSSARTGRELGRIRPDSSESSSFPQHAHDHSINSTALSPENPNARTGFIKSICQTLREYIQRYRILDGAETNGLGVTDGSKTPNSSGVYSATSTRNRYSDDQRRYPRRRIPPLDTTYQHPGRAACCDGGELREQRKSLLSRWLFPRKVANLFSAKATVIPSDIILLPHVMRKNFYECLNWVFNPCVPFVTSSSKWSQSSHMEGKAVNPVFKSIRRIVDRYRRSKSKRSLFSWKFLYSLLQSPPVYAIPEVHYEHMLMYGPIQSPLLLNIFVLHVFGYIFQVYYHWGNTRRLLVVSVLKALIVLFTLIAWLLEMASYMKVRDLAFTPPKSEHSTSTDGKPGRQSISKSVRNSGKNDGHVFHEHDLSALPEYTRGCTHSDSMLYPSSRRDREVLQRLISPIHNIQRRRAHSGPSMSVQHFRKMHAEFPCAYPRRGIQHSSSHHYRESSAPFHVNSGGTHSASGDSDSWDLFLL